MWNKLVNRTKHTRKKWKLQWSMMLMISMGWFLPLIVILFSVTFIVSGRIKGQITNNVITSFDSAVEICQIRVMDSIDASKKASYDNTIKNSWLLYKRDEDSLKLYNELNYYLRKTYRFNSNFIASMVYFIDEKDQLYYTYNEFNGGTYQSITQFKSKAYKEIDNIAKDIDTATVFVNIDGHVYMIRNLIKSNFKPYAVLVMEIDTEEVFSGLKSVWGYEDGEIYINGDALIIPEKNMLKDMQLLEGVRETNFVYGGKKETSYVYRHIKRDGGIYTYAVRLDSHLVVQDMHSIIYVYKLIFIFTIPLSLIVIYFFHSRVTRPINELLKGTYEIRSGNYGLHVKQKGKNLEFIELDDAFNSMSDQLEYQFKKIYLEELAARDAKIMALQSQINPHFLNNTLEIINWEARLSDNFKVSSMIESLSTMLEATMNRKNRSLITLREELNYVDAYLYIISQRFGEKFQVVKEIDETLLEVEIPRLIIQPIVENAVEHGCSINYKGIVTISIYSEDEYMHIEIKNNKPMSNKDREKIERLLKESGDLDKNNNMEHHVSLGIRNVNQRIKIIYGKDCGLKVNSDSNGNTINTITVKINK